ncbi:MAG: PQQ-binding-like beta-propeller repeat protein [Polyangiales bacterium]|nr:PQQ-binding-like beta-propeller repeat protein [Myxococcales bacterium]MCB9661464.1 PQQ-binding-like beta-propeller repeat protein [Sandaracinaceae bacterium]
MYALALLLGVGSLLTTVRPAARARPVTIGVYQELPFGVARSHPSVTEGARTTRDGRSLARLPAREPSVLYTAMVGSGAVAAPIALTNNLLLAVAGDAAAHVDAAGTVGPHGVSLRGGGGVSLTPGDGYVVAETDGLAFFDRALSGLTRVPVAGLSPHAPLALEDSSVVVSAGARVLRVDATGREHFALPVASRAHSPIARTPAGELVAATTQELVVFSEDGRVLRRELLGEPPVAGPAVALDGTVWMLTRRELVAFEARGGVRVRVPASPAGPVTHGGLAIAADGSVRASVLGTGVLSVNASGAELWRFPLELAHFVVVDAAGVALSLTRDGLLVALDAAGQERWRTRLSGGGPQSAPVIGVDGTVYVGMRGGSLVALR